MIIKMDGKNHSQLIRNLDFIALNISSLPQLLNLLRQKSVISKVESEEIECPEPYKTRTKLVDLICKKGNETFPVFVQCLRDSGNEIIARKLLAGTKAKEEKQIYFGVTAPNIFYMGREKEMESLQEHWKDCMTKKTFSIVAITGLGGVGTTELARNFAKWFHESVGGHCIWVDAGTLQKIQNSFRDLARDLKISHNVYFWKEKKFLEIVQEVYQKLFKQKVLIIFDSIESYEMPVVKLLIDLSNKQPSTDLKPFVITTSRLRDTEKSFGTQCNVLHLKVLTKDSAKQFFYKSLNFNESAGKSTDELIEKLCERLQYYPLALQQAASYIKQMSVNLGNEHDANISRYLLEIEKDLKTLLDHKLPYSDELGKIRKTTYSTWRITFNKLSESSEGGQLAMDIMNIISFLSPDNIPTRMVINILQKMGKTSNTKNIDEFFYPIVKHSLIIRSGEKISVHRLVQDVTRLELEARLKLRSILRDIADIMINLLNTDEISLAELVHAQMLWQHIRSKEMIENHGELLGLVCYKFYRSGKYKDLLNFIRESGEFLESTLGVDNKWTLQMKYWKGKALRELGEYSQSLEMLNDVCERQKKTLGEKDDDHLDTVNDVGMVYLRLNNYEEAIKKFEYALQLAGNEHTIALYLKNNIAEVFHEQNKLDEAMKVYEEILAVRERTLRVDHPDTLVTKHNIACVKLGLKNYRDALKELEKVQETQKKVLVWNHPNTLNTKLFIAVTHHYLGEHEKCIQLLKEVQTYQVEMLGPRHPHTIRIEEVMKKVDELKIIQLGLESWNYHVSKKKVFPNIGVLRL